MSLWIRLCNHTYIHTYILHRCAKQVCVFEGCDTPSAVQGEGNVRLVPLNVVT